MKQLIAARLVESIRVKEEVLKETGTIEDIANSMVQCLKSGKRIYFFGNGGSAADAQHLAAEVVSRFYIERRGLPAEALNANTSVITAIANDYSFDRIFARQIEASGMQGDIAFGLSTSGDSPNVIEAIKVAKTLGMVTIGFSGMKGNTLKKLADYCFCAPSTDTPRVQEVHITIGHILCEIVEKQIFEN